MKTEYGTKMAGALKAVAQMHSDTSKLLQDCDQEIGKGRPSIFGSYATRDLTYNFQADFWMAEGVYRYYQAGPALVDGVTVAFFHASEPDDPRSDTEPLLLVARIQYATAGDGASSKGNCKEWDIWHMYFDWVPDRKLGQILSVGRAGDGRIEWARLIAVPLFSISRIEDVAALMSRVIDAAPRGASVATA